MWYEEKTRSLIARHLDRYLTIRCHGNNVTSFICEGSVLLYLFVRKSKAPLDANEATQFTSTAWTVLPAHYKKRNTTNLQEEQTQIQLMVFQIGLWKVFAGYASEYLFVTPLLVWLCFLIGCLIFFFFVTWVSLNILAISKIQLVV